MHRLSKSGIDRRGALAAGASLVAGSLISLPSICRAQGIDPLLEKAMGDAWDVLWSRFFHPDSQTLMDYLSSYEPGRGHAHLPTADEVGRQYPNPCGYGTGMEDGMILAGAALSMICDRYAVSDEAELRNKASQVFAGMQRCATVHGVPGFVARNVCPEDGKSVYINSSRDQYTHFVHGLWKYYHSPLADDVAKQQIRDLLAAVAERMIQFVTPENDYDFCRADGQRCPLTICRMWNVQAHEAARLPMIYAAAWDVTGNQRYHQLWRKYIVDAVDQSAAPAENNPAYALLQMQASLELLAKLEPDPALKDEIQNVMQHVAALADKRLSHSVQAVARKSADEMRVTGPDWRRATKWIDQQGYRNPQWGPYREIWHLTREIGESALIPLMADGTAVASAERQRFWDVLKSTDYQSRSGCGILFHLAVYWKARRYDRL